MTGRVAHPWLVLVLVCLAQFMVVLDATVVNVALPSIQTDLKMSETDLQWVVNSYTLIFGGFLLLGGRAGDLLGRKRLFLAGVVVFTAASLLNGLAQSSQMLILTRGLQGLGAAFVSPAALSIVTTTFAEGADRAKALGVWSAIAAGGGGVGLLLGGVLTDTLSWPWIFFVNIPIGIATFVLSARFVPESTAEMKHRRFDVTGAITVTAGLIALVYAIVRAESAGWTSASTLTIAAVAVALLAAFVVVEGRSRAPLVRLDIFSVPSLRAANIVLLFVAAGLYAMFFFNSLFVQRVLGYSPLEAGLAFMPFTAGIVLGAGIAQQLVARVGLRGPAVVGMLISSGGMALLIMLSSDSTYVSLILPSVIVTSLAMGTAFVPLILIATAGVPPRDAGLASGLFNTSQQIGGALGIAILSTIAAAATRDSLGGIAHPTKAQESSALVDGFQLAFLGGAIIVAAASLLLLALLRRRDVEAIPTGKPATVAA